MSEVSQRPRLSRGDYLAIERTQLANERTFLAYFRTSIAFLTSGLAILHIEFFEEIKEVSFLLMSLAPLILVFGIWRLRAARQRVLRSYEATEQELAEMAGVDRSR